MFKLTFFYLLFFMLCADGVQAQQNQPYIKILNTPNRWVDSVYRHMTRRQKIAQLFMIRAHTNRGQAYEDSVARVIEKEHIGGLVFFQGGPGRQSALTNRYQALSKIPLMIAMDAEWGLAMRLDSTIAYPYQMTLGAIQDNTLIYKMGQQVAKDFKRLGMQINFAPVMDINNNPNNTIINYRSFGENRFNVAAKSIAYMQGMQDNGILTTAKHYPGHGDTDVDSHYDLPQLKFTTSRLDSLEMYPFKQAIKQNLSGVMVAHMNIPALDSTKNLPSTLSKPIITGWLKQKQGFNGLVFTDAMEMKGVVKFFANGEADVRALMAGTDVIELSENSLRAEKLIRKAIHQRKLTWDDISEKVKKILYAKYWAGLYNYQPINTQNVAADLNRPEAKNLKQQMADAAITILKGADSLYVGKSFTTKTAILNIGTKETSLFAKEIKKNDLKATVFVIPKNASVLDLQIIKNQLLGFDRIIMAIHDTRKRPLSNLDYTNDVKLFIADIAAKNTVSVVFANPYTLAGLPGIEKSKSLIMAYQDTDELELAALKVMGGKLKTKGKLPVSINAFFKYGDGL
ncbi:MAG: glycoside hydrolase family 3 [Sphingobacteriales bacterium]|nr:MAG: glycoside hydrolase family 3 [Sphingobacteriales bacterium]TAF80859.1 MAG: glycoside hydrolase family 3 [Sphingobacteriales bacterium]